MMAFFGDSSTSIATTGESAGRQPPASLGESVSGSSVKPRLVTTERLVHPLPPDRVRERRRWVLGSLLILALTAVLLCVLVMWSRDKTTALLQLRPAREAQVTFQRRLDRLGLLPAEAAELDKAGLYYLFSDLADRQYARECRDRLIIAHSAAIDLYLANRSRVVMTYEQGKVEVALIPSIEMLRLLDRQKKNIDGYFNAKDK